MQIIPDLTVSEYPYTNTTGDFAFEIVRNL